MQSSLNQDEWVATCLSSMIDDDQLEQNLKSAITFCQNPKLMAQLKSIFEDCPVTQWENMETVKYWKEMDSHGWKQNLD